MAAADHAEGIRAVHIAAPCCLRYLCAPRVYQQRVDMGFVGYRPHAEHAIFRLQKDAFARGVIGHHRGDADAEIYKQVVFFAHFVELSGDVFRYSGFCLFFCEGKHF